MLEYAWPALAYILTPNSLWLLALGAMLGFVFAVLPGLSGPQVMALLLPITFTMPSADAMILLMGASGVTGFGASITAILINAPGTSQSAATSFDGYPLTKQGRAGYAIGASATASLVGALFGVCILMLILPLAREVVLAFSYPEYFMMAVMGLSMIAILAQGNPWRAFIAGGIGLCLSFMGFDPMTGAIRYTFGWDYLWDGAQLIPAIIGLFGIAEAISLFQKRGSISRERPDSSMRGVWEGVVSVFVHWGTTLRGSMIGTLVGVVPGVGGSVANILAYGQAVATAKDKSKFGKGDIRGVIGPEAANNATDGGGLVPTLVFGIPGGLEMAVLLGALTLHGINPGPRLIIDYPDIALMLIYALVISNVFIAIVGLMLSKPMTYLTLIKTVYIAPVIMVLGLVGAYAANGYVEDVLVTLGFGVLGYLMMRYDYSRIALLIALVLGSLLQTSFHQTNDLWGVGAFFTRPISLGLFLVTLTMVAMPAILSVRKKMRAAK